MSGAEHIISHKKLALYAWNHLRKISRVWGESGFPAIASGAKAGTKAISGEYMNRLRLNKMRVFKRSKCYYMITFICHVSSWSRSKSIRRRHFLFWPLNNHLGKHQLFTWNLAVNATFNTITYFNTKQERRSWLYHFRNISQCLGKLWPVKRAQILPTYYVQPVHIPTTWSRRLETRL